MGYNDDSDERFGGGGDPFAGLTREQRKTLAEAKQKTAEFTRDFDRGLDEYERTHPGEEDKEEKFLGVIPMPGYMVSVVEGSWNTLFGTVAPWLQQKAFNISANHLGKVPGLGNLNSGQIKTTSLAVATAVAVGPQIWAPISSIINGYSEERKDLTRTSKLLAPVLEDVKGKHGLASFMKVKLEDNEMIYAHRKHKQSGHGLQHLNNYLKLIGAAPTFAVTLFNQSGVIARQHGVDVPALTKPQAAHTAGHNPAAAGGDMNLVFISGVANAAMTPVIDVFKKVNERKHKKKSRSVTAIEMVLELEKQVSAGGDNRHDYAFPKASNRRPAALVDYIVEVIKCHQLDMEALDAEYTPVRKSLDNQLRDIATPIADAIKKGDISTLALIRLIGEGHIVKNKGRSLAKPSDVKALVEKMSGHSASYTQIDPKEYFADAAFNKKELKEALSVLSGDEKLHFAAMFPDVVLAEAGMAEKDIKEIRASTMKHYETNLGKIITGLAAEEDKALHDMGLAKEEIKEIRDAAEQVKARGEEAVHEVRANPTNKAGIERVLVSAAMAKVLGGDDAHYMGKLMGTQAVEKTAAVDVVKAKVADIQEDSAEHGDAHKPSHAKREHQRRIQDSDSQETGLQA